MCHAPHNFSVFLWLLNFFFVLVAIRNYKVQFLSKTHLRVHCNFKSRIFSNSFLGTGHNAPCIKQFFSISMIAELLFSCLLWLRTKKFSFHQKCTCECIATSNFEFSQIVFRHRAQCAMHQIIFSISMIAEHRFLCLWWLEATKFIFIKGTHRDSLQLQILNFLKQFFSIRAWSGATQSIKALSTRKGQDAIIIRRQNLIHRIPCKNPRLHSIVLLVTCANEKKVVPLDVAHRWLINYLSLQSVWQMPNM